jgi:peptidoglycan/xylan/chitin deacetylase (PgdA/CDA1 family)
MASAGKERLLALVGRAGAFAAARALTSRSLRILAYHGIWITPGHAFGNRLFMSPEQFEERMTWLARSRYPVLPLGEAVERLAAGTLPRGATVITIDDGWHTSYTHMIPVLERLALPATIYVTTYYVDRPSPVVNVAITYLALTSPLVQVDLEGLPLGGTHSLGTLAERNRLAGALQQAVDRIRGLEARVEALLGLAERLAVPTAPWMANRQFHNMTPGELGDAHRSGIDIQLHTHRHRGVLDETLARELADNRAALTRACGPDARFDHFCYPSGTYRPSAEVALAADGVRSATLVEHGINPPGAHPYRLRRFLDGRSVSQTMFEAYLSGALELAVRATGHRDGG